MRCRYPPGPFVASGLDYGRHELLSPRNNAFSPVSPRAPMKHQYPEIQGGGSLILAWQIRNKHVLVVGGGEVGVLKYSFKHQLMYGRSPLAVS